MTLLILILQAILHVLLILQWLLVIRQKAHFPLSCLRPWLTFTLLNFIDPSFRAHGTSLCLNRAKRVSMSKPGQ